MYQRLLNILIFDQVLRQESDTFFGTKCTFVRDAGRRASSVSGTVQPFFRRQSANGLIKSWVIESFLWL